MFELTSTGDFKNTEKFLEAMLKGDYILKVLHAAGQEGAAALARNTPKDTGMAASSWGYEIKQEKNAYSIIWTNSNDEGGVNVIILLQYGHGTGTGGYVQGRDFINPTMKPIFDKIADRVWKAVTSA